MNTKRQRKPIWRLRNRRGAVLVWFGISISAMLMVTAVVLDFAYWYAATQELQTAADAAALRGARMFQFSQEADPAYDVDTAAVNWSVMNDAQLDGVTITADQVHLVWWNTTPPGGIPGEPVLDPASAAWPTDASGVKRKPNAVLVENGQIGKTLIGQIFGWNTPQLGRRAVAAIQYLNAGRCLRPWGLPMSRITWMVTNNDGKTGEDSLYRELDPYEVGILANLSDAARTIVMVPPRKSFQTQQKPYPGPDWPTASAEWNGFRLDNDATNTSNQGMDEFRRLSAGGCVTSGEAYGVGDYANTDLPGANLETNMQNAVEDGYGQGQNVEEEPTCYYAEGSANCYSDATLSEQGAIVNVAWTSSTSATGTEPVRAYMLGQFKIMCLFRDPDETCTHQGGAPYSNTGYPQGTLIGMPIADFFTRLMPDYEWGNVPSTSSRLFLVK